MALNPTDAPVYDNRGGYVPGQIDSTGGGYDATAGEQSNSAYSGSVAPSYAGGYYGDQVVSSGGGYDPTTGYSGTSNTIGGSAAQTTNYNTAPSYAGGYYGDQQESSGGGYNPSSPSAYLTSDNTVGGSAAISEQYNGAPVYDNRGGYVPGQVESTGGGYDPKKDAGADYESSTARKATSGLPEGGGTAGAKKTEPKVAFQSAADEKAATAADSDWRVRISLADKANIFYKESGPNPNTLMAPLRETNGVIFPYTPSITVNHTATYTSVTPTHSNYSQPFYNNSDVQDITIAGEFTVQSVAEGKYLLAAVYFFRSATKMFFGQGANAGNPPPIVFLDGYGSHYFPHVPCVVTSFSHTLPNEVDYIEIPITTVSLTDSVIQPDNANIGAVNTLDNEGMKYVPNFGSKKAATGPGATKTEYKSVQSFTRVPAVSTISISVKPVYSRKNLHERFNLDSFAAGRLLKDKDLGFGGFI